MKCPGANSSALNPAITADSMRRVNWVINTYFNPTNGINPVCHLPFTVPVGKYQSRVSTPPGIYRAATSADMQAVIWTLTGNNRYGGEGSNDDVVNCILYNTYNHKIYRDYTPPCDGTLAVVVLPCDETLGYAAQATITQVPLSSLDVPCECAVSTVH